MDPDRRLTCGFCGRGVEAERLCGRLIRHNACAAHLNCLQYSSNLVQYKLSTFGGFLVDKVQTEMKRGSQLTCDVCVKTNDASASKVRGATCQCALETCPASFHFPCAKETAITTCCVDDSTKDVVYRIFCCEQHKEEFTNTSKNTNEHSGSESAEGDDDVIGHALSGRSHSTPRSCYHQCRAKKDVSRRSRSEVLGTSLPDDQATARLTTEDVNINMNAWNHAPTHRHKCPHALLDGACARPTKRPRHQFASPESDDSDSTGSSSDDLRLDSLRAVFPVADGSTTDSAQHRHRGRPTCCHNGLPDTRLLCRGRDCRYDSSDTSAGREGDRKLGRRPGKKRTQQQQPRGAVCGCRDMDVAWNTDHIGNVFFQTTPYAPGIQDFATISLCDSGSSCPTDSAVDRRIMLDVIGETFAALVGAAQPTIVDVDEPPRIITLDDDSECDVRNRLDQRGPRLDSSDIPVELSSRRDGEALQHSDTVSMSEQAPAGVECYNPYEQPVPRLCKNRLDEQLRQRNVKNSLHEHEQSPKQKRSSLEQSSQHNNKNNVVEPSHRRNDKKSLDEMAPQCHSKHNRDEQSVKHNEKKRPDDPSPQRHGKRSLDEQPSNKKRLEELSSQRHSKYSSDEQSARHKDKKRFDELATEYQEQNTTNSCALYKRSNYSVVSAISMYASCHLCHHVGGLKKRSSAACQQPRKECVLCFIETDTATLSEQHKQEVTTYATQTYDVVPKHVIVWVPKIDEEELVPSQYTIYLIREISQALKDRNYLDVERLLFGLRERDVDTFGGFQQLHEGLGTQRCERVQTELHDAVKDDLSTAATFEEHKVAHLCRVQQLPIFMMYLYVCDETDPVRRIRSRICHKQRSLFPWERDTCLECTGALLPKTSEYFRAREAEELQFWLERNAEPEISYYDPQIEMVTCDQPESAIFQLREHFQQHYTSSSHGMSTLVFLGPIDKADPAASCCVAEWIPNVIAEVLTSIRDVFIVLGVDVTNAPCCLKDVTPVLPENVFMKVYSYADPCRLPVTCVLLHFEMLS